VDGSAAALDHGEIGGILRVVEAVERPIFDAKAVIPEVQDAALRLGGGGGWGRRGWDDGRRRVVAAEGNARAAEAGRRSGCGLGAWTGSLSMRLLEKLWE